MASTWDLLTKNAEQYTHGWLEDSQCAPTLKRTPLVPDRAYVQIWLRRMWIVKTGKLWKKYYAAIHSETETSEASFKQLIMPPGVRDVPASQLDRVIVENQLLMGPTPYRGGNLKVNVALLSVKSADFAGPFLEVLSDLGAAAGVPYVSLAQPFLKPLTKGVDLLTG